MFDFWQLLLEAPLQTFKILLILITWSLKGNNIFQVNRDYQLGWLPLGANSQNADLPTRDNKLAKQLHVAKKRNPKTLSSALRTESCYIHMLVIYVTSVSRLTYIFLDPFTAVNILWHQRTRSTLVNPLTPGSAWMRSQHCGYWCPGAKAPGHQHPQCWLNINCIGPVSYKKYCTYGV